MNELVETRPGSWILVAGSCAIHTTLLTFIARLSEQGPVRVLDCGNQFNHQHAKSLTFPSGTFLFN
jgi:hypothetical protein